MGSPVTPNLTERPTVELPNPAPGAGPEGTVVVNAVDTENNTVTLAPHPQATAPAHPEVEVQTSAPGLAPDSLPNPTSHGTQVFGGPTQPSIDTTKFDDIGNVKDLGDHGEGFGPRGKNMPRDVMTDAQKQAHADAAEKVLQAGLAPTNAIDSVGKAKGSFVVTPQGHDDHGMRLPDKVDYSQPIEPVAAHVGPRGVGAPQDTFHGERPKKS